MNPITKGDGESIKNTQLWSLVCQEIDFRIHSLMKNIPNCPVGEFQEFKAKLTALEAVKRIPEDAIERDYARGSER